MHNPIAILCSQLGLDDAALAKILGCTTRAILAALAEQPKEPLATYLNLGLALGVKMRLVADQPLGLWFDLAAIDGLHYSRDFRHSVGFDPLPANRGELRRAIKKLRQRHLNYGKIARHLQASFIPTVTGMRTWRHTTIGQHLKLQVSGEDDAEPLGMTDQFRLAFRNHIQSHLLVAMCPFDPFASVRHQVQQTERDGQLLVQTQAPLPASIRRWMVAAVASLHWFKADQWGEIKHHDQDEVHGQHVSGAQLPPAGSGDEAAQATEAGHSSPVDQPGSAHDSDHLPG